MDDTADYDVIWSGTSERQGTAALSLTGPIHSTLEPRAIHACGQTRSPIAYRVRQAATERLAERRIGTIQD